MKGFWKSKPKPQRAYPQSLMAVDERGHLVLDHKALLESGVMDRQYQAAHRLSELLKKKKSA